MDSERPIGALLREWRLRRGLSQLDLSVQSGISTRHVSFVETGRTVPSPAMVERFAQHLDIPLRERNRLLVAAGYAPTYQHRALDDPDLVQARAAVRRVLDAHEPFPALAIDRHWDLLFANAAAEVFFDGVAAELLEPPINMMRIGLHPKGFASRVRNIEQVRGFMLPRLARQAERSGDPELAALHAELSAFASEGTVLQVDPSEVALPIQFEHRGTQLSLFNAIMRFGTAFDVTLDEIAIESYFPADQTTSAYLHALAGR
ncbi:helix-turn-helix domain-containing protein [Nocardia sp. CA-135398]|uniref:helix-turn-helix domain-containing protein n=1 Tax=Nocardia sp. CA-135398 TaxID=3239977 RepID=UPI003D969F00